MLTRRQLLKTAPLFTGGLLLGCGAARSSAPIGDLQLMMPEESEPHKRTWMAFVANDYVWSRRQVPAVKQDLIRLAKTIAKYEPVSMLVAPEDYEEADYLLREPSPHPIEMVEFATDDLWLRDTGPTFVRGSDGQKYAIDFNFNGWGNKQEHELDAQVARFIADHTRTPIQETMLTLEGGSFEVDGKGTALLTKSSVLNNNRNPGLSQAEVEAELKRLLGLRKIIWLEGIRGEDITDAHIDFYARFTKPGEVIVSRENYEDSFDYDITRENIAALEEATDADGNRLNLLIVDTPEVFNETYGTRDFAAGYIGYYVCNGAVIMQKFGDEVADARAFETVAAAFPDRAIEQIAIDGIASGGGSIHCATQQEIIN